MYNKILNRYIFFCLCFFSSRFSDAQYANIRCLLRDQNGNIIKGAVFLQDAESSVIGTKLPQYDKLSTSFRNRLIAGQAKEDQSVVLKTDRRLPYYLYFSAPGKKTYMTFFPPSHAEELSVSIILYDTTFQRDESEVNIQTNDERINKWLKAAALTSRTAQTRIMDYLDAKVEYITKNGSDDGFVFDLSAYYKQMLQVYNSSEERQLKNFILAQIAFLCIGNKYQVDEKYLIELVRETPSNDWLWITGIGQTALSGIYLGLGKFEKINPFYSLSLNH